MTATSLSLLDRVLSGLDPTAWESLVELYTPLIRGYLRHLQVPDQDADDLTQEVLSVVVRELPAFRHNHHAGALRCWLRTITVNRAHEALRKRERMPAALGSALDELEDPNSEFARVWDEEHNRHVVQVLLDRVSRECRPETWHAFRRVVLDGAPVDLVAIELQTTVNAVTIAKCRVLARLRQQAAGLLDDP